MGTPPMTVEVSDQAEPIAHQEFTFVFPNGRVQPGNVSLGPISSNSEHVFYCQVHERGLSNRTFHVAGGSMFHALCLAIWKLRSILQEFEDAGGKITLSNDSTSIPVDAIFGSFTQCSVHKE